MRIAFKRAMQVNAIRMIQATQQIRVQPVYGAAIKPDFLLNLLPVRHHTQPRQLVLHHLV
jgi:hypothetical protein